MEKSEKNWKNLDESGKNTEKTGNNPKKKKNISKFLESDYYIRP